MGNPFYLLLYSDLLLDGFGWSQQLDIFKKVFLTELFYQPYSKVVSLFGQGQYKSILAKRCYLTWLACMWIDNQLIGAAHIPWASQHG